MALDADYLVDRRRLKRRLLVWRTLAIVAIVGMVVAAVGRFAGYSDSSYIARLKVHGIITDDLRRNQALARIGADHGAKALIVHIDSPGGTVVGGEALYRTLREVAKTKPVVAVMGQVATSAGYMVALAADRIIAREGTITGSIGVLLQTTEVTGLLEKLGIVTEAIKSGPLKAVPSPFERMTPEVRKVTQALVDDILQLFVEMVAERRGMDWATARSLADGRVFTGRLALKRKLIDAIGGEDAAIEWLERDKSVAPDLPVHDVKIRGEVDRWIDFLDALGRKTVFSERLTLDGLISVWHPQLR